VKNSKKSQQCMQIQYMHYQGIVIIMKHHEHSILLCLILQKNTILNSIFVIKCPTPKQAAYINF